MSLLPAIKKLNDFVRAGIKSSAPIDVTVIDDITPLALTEEVKIILFTAVDNKALDTKYVIKRFINENQTDDVFYALYGYMIRNTPDINFYISTLDYGTVHVLVYVYLNLYNKTGFEYLVSMLLTKGANPQLAYEKDSKVSVNDWLRREGYNTDMLAPGTLHSLSPATLLTIDVLLDRDTRTTSVTIQNFVLAIRSRSNKIFRYFTQQSYKNNILEKIKDTAFEASILYLNDGAFDILVTYGATLGQNMSDLLSDRYDRYIKSDLTIPTAILIKMMERLASSGITMQGKLPPSVEKIYKETPKWVKHCSIETSFIEEDLIHISRLLNIDYRNKGELCSKLRELVKISRSKLEAGYITRRQYELLSRLYSVRDFIDKAPPYVKLSNESVFSTNPFLINNNNIVIYRDNKGSFWGIPRKTFPEVLKSRINIYNGEYLPEHVIREIESKVNLPRSLDFNEITSILY